ncbi:hypothetical protein CCICO_06270 [Corynebacterium ciconiae DSM 44920]|uniref:hypothetical protein n=1 Tax=Corynebacterium ciconiae TaxID=227319 RepID=UPI0003648B62|nr:hypothetical protein [Corynebacterium ciconiae]WKD61281.1 hypothetical protein CCICO_06270 [Corynebacterium ciconiae DSM 44920]
MDLSDVTTYSKKRLSIVESRLSAHKEFNPSLPDADTFAKWMSWAVPQNQYTDGVPHALSTKLGGTKRSANYEMGDILCLDEDNPDYPWKAGLISLIFPIPVHALPPRQPSENPYRTQVPGSGWHWGRYRGTSIFGSIQDGKQAVHKHLGSGVEQYFNSLASMFGEEPSAEHMTADAFPFLDSSPLTSEELGSEDLAELQNHLRDRKFPDAHSTQDGSSPEVLNYVRTFDHGAPATTWTLRTANNPSVRYKPLELTPEINGHVELRALEFLQFNKIKDSRPCADGDTAQEIAQAFLVCHLQCTNLTHAGLRMVSTMLDRPRNGTTIRDGHGPGVIIGPYVSRRDTTRSFTEAGSEDEREGYAQGFLRDLFSIAIDSMDSYFPEDKQDLPLYFSPGGFISSRRHSAESSTTEKFRETIMPLRIISLIPNDSAATMCEEVQACIDDKSLDLPPGGDYEELWCEAWAESIINAQDRFTHELKSLDSSAAQHEEVSSFANWCFRSSSTCMVGIKRQSDLQHDLFFAGLCQTRFVDVGLLAMRQYLGLVRFHNRMEDGIYDFRSSRTTDSDLSGLAVDAERLKRATDTFDLLTLDYLGFRNKVWQRTIPKRSFATALLHVLQDRLGVTSLSEEFDKEMELRKSILQSRYDREMLRIRERDEKQRRRQQQRQNEAARTTQVIFTVVALIIGVVPAFEFLPLPSNDSGNWEIFLIQLALAGCLCAFVYYYAKKKKDTPTSGDDT